MRFRLSAEDRERLGGPEWLDFDERLSTQEAEKLEAAGADPYALGTLRSSKPTVEALRIVIWLCLTRIGVDVKFEDVHFDLFALDAEREPGKAPSARSGSRTRGRSAASSRG